MEPAALRTMAVAKVRDVGIDLVADAPAFAVSFDQLRLPVVMSSPRLCVGCSSPIIVVSGHSNHRHASY